MRRWKGFLITKASVVSAIITIGIFFSGNATGLDLPEIKEKGVLRHLGVCYANFVTGSGDGLDVELMKLFAENIGVDYKYIETSWGDVISDLTGERITHSGNTISVVGTSPIKGDVIANGFTIIPWREQAIDFSIPTFPTQVWLIARSDSSMDPIFPYGTTDKDIAEVKNIIDGCEVLGVENTCLDPSLYNISQCGGQVVLFTGKLNEIVPAILRGVSETALLDVPDALVALNKWPGKIKVIGPVSHTQNMGAGFAKSSPQLREAFNLFFKACISDGTYRHLVRKYYPTVFHNFPEFFEGHSAS